jgi:hypothetical protein
MSYFSDKEGNGKNKTIIKTKVNVQVAKGRTDITEQIVRHIENKKK